MIGQHRSNARNSLIELVVSIPRGVKLFLCFAILFCFEAHAQRVRIHLQHEFGSAALRRDSVEYRNALGQSLRISRFRYYLSQPTLRAEQAESEICGQSYLVDDEDTSSLVITLQPRHTKALRYLDLIIGVDSIHNTSGLQEGALDPINGMFWAWNTGYIFHKLEGKSPASPEKGGLFEFHVGGSSAPAQCIRHVRIDLGKTFQLHSQTTLDITLAVDVAKILSGVHTIDLAKLWSVTDARNAELVADNYSSMIHLIDVHAAP